jgi:hypothetical protein
VCFSIMEMEEEWPKFASWKAVMSLRGRLRGGELEREKEE